MRRLLVGAVVILVVVSSASDGGSAKVPSNPCSYISAAEVGSAVGGPVTAGRFETEGPRWGDSAVGCIFNPRGAFAVAIPGSNADFEFARVMFIDAPTFRSDTEARQYSVNVFPVTGLADAAYEVLSVHYEVVFVRKGDYHVAFEVAAGLGSSIELGLRLAHIVVPRLPA